MQDALHTHWLGRTPYEASLRTMREQANAVKAHGHTVILGYEYDPIITLGLRASEADVHEHGATIVRASRGGQATLHNPGQLVIYPIFAFKKHGFTAKEWVCFIHNVSASVLQSCNIIIINKNNGLYTETGKIASVGFDLRGGVSTHGIAINISNNLENFSWISACGVENAKMDRVLEYKSISLEEFFGLWCSEFTRAFREKLQAGRAFDECLTQGGLAP